MGPEQVDELWDDVVTTLRSGHFIGSIVLNDEQDHQPQVIDGQQRLTTPILLLRLIRDCYYDLDSQVRTRPQRLMVSDEFEAGYAKWKLRNGDANWPVFRDFVLRAPDDPPVPLGVNAHSVPSNAVFSVRVELLGKCVHPLCSCIGVAVVCVVPQLFGAPGRRQDDDLVGDPSVGDAGGGVLGRNDVDQQRQRRGVLGDALADFGPSQHDVGDLRRAYRGHGGYLQLPHDLTRLLGVQLTDLDLQALADFVDGEVVEHAQGSRPRPRGGSRR